MSISKHYIFQNNDEKLIEFINYLLKLELYIRKDIFNLITFLVRKLFYNKKYYEVLGILNKLKTFELLTFKNYNRIGCLYYPLALFFF